MGRYRLGGLVIGMVVFLAAGTALGGESLRRRPSGFRELDEVKAIRSPGALSHLGQGTINITPDSPVLVANCIPFGNNTDYGFTGFIYRSVGRFFMRPGDKFAFDLGRRNGQDIRRNIYFAQANKNPALVPEGSDVVSQGIKALKWTKIVPDSQIPRNPRGNSIVGDYELVYTATRSFDFFGGGLIVGFGGSPPGAYADVGCEQVLVVTMSADASGHFYARFCQKPHLTLAALDRAGTCSGTGIDLGGIVISAPRVLTVDVDIKPGDAVSSIKLENGRTIAVAVLTGDDFRASTIEARTACFGDAGERSERDCSEKHGRGHSEDVDGDGDQDLVLHFEAQETGIDLEDKRACLAATTSEGIPLNGCDVIRVV